jgi:hypothetical protein
MITDICPANKTARLPFGVIRRDLQSAWSLAGGGKIALADRRKMRGFLQKWSPLAGDGDLN